MKGAMEQKLYFPIPSREKKKKPKEEGQRKGIWFVKREEVPQKDGREGKFQGTPWRKAKLWTSSWWDKARIETREKRRKGSLVS